uniref:RING-type domain-containing protein n=1 Tax=Panagrolaimus superbus TaxID=310955 RepID=A0A914Y517_9BILA
MNLLNSEDDEELSYYTCDEGSSSDASTDDDDEEEESICNNDAVEYADETEEEEDFMLDYTENETDLNIIERDFNLVMSFNDQNSNVEERQKVLRLEYLPEEMDYLANEVSAVIGYSLDICKVLLHFFTWNRHKLLEKFYECDSAEDFFKLLKLQLPILSSSPSTIDGDCLICFETTSLTSLSCKHYFCADCWNYHLVTRFRQESDPYPFCPA